MGFLCHGLLSFWSSGIGVLKVGPLGPATQGDYLAARGVVLVSLVDLWESSLL